ncbi:rRNA-processing protein utp21, partial [Coemansia sp. RSA 1933]
MDSVGIFLWASRAQFADVTLRQISPGAADEEAEAVVAMPTTSSAGLEDDAHAHAQQGEEGPAHAGADVYISAEQLTENMVTLSGQPRSKWQTLLNLAVIKKRNAPQKPPQAPEQAPFFLPTAAGVEHRFDLDAPPPVGQDAAEPTSKIVSTASAQSALARALYRAEETMAYEGALAYLGPLGPSAIDVEIRTLPLDDNLRAVKA